MNIIYNKNSGFIVSVIANDQDYKIYYRNMGVEFTNELACLNKEIIPSDLYNYYVVDSSLVKYKELEMLEKETYRKILTDDERLLNKLKPTNDEIRKAESTIETLSLIQEVIL